MNHRFRAATAVAWSLLMSAVTDTLAGQPGAPETQEGSASSFSASLRNGPDLALQGDGTAVIVWAGATRTDTSQPSDLRGVFGATTHTQFYPGVYGSQPMNTTPLQRTDTAPRIAMNAYGRFVLVWLRDPGGSDAGGIRAQIYDRSDLQTASDFDVGASFAASPATGRFVSDVAIARNGDFVVGWDNPGTGPEMRLFSAGGLAKSSIFPGPAGSGIRLGMDGDGNFIALTRTAQNQVVFQRYDTAGAALGPLTTVSAAGAISDLGEISMNEAGGFAITWTSKSSPAADSDVYLRVYDAGGTPRTIAPVLAHQISTANQVEPSIAIAQNGFVVVSWTGLDGSQQKRIFAHRFDANGNSLSPEFQVNQLDPGALSAVAMDADGDFTVAWENDGFYAYVGYRSYVGSEPIDMAVTARITTTPVLACSTVEISTLIDNLHRQTEVFGAGSATYSGYDYNLPAGFRLLDVSGPGACLLSGSVPYFCDVQMPMAPSSSQTHTLKLQTPLIPGRFRIQFDMRSTHVDDNPANDQYVLDVVTQANPDAVHLSLDATHYTVNAESTTLVVRVQRHGSAQGAVSASLLYDPGLADLSSAFPGGFTPLNWASGDSSERMIELTAMRDPSITKDQTLALRLEPHSGACDGNNNSATVTLRSQQTSGGGDSGGGSPDDGGGKQGGGGLGLVWLMTLSLLSCLRALRMS